MRNSALKSEECGKSQLTGYRTPSTWEKQEIKKRLLSELRGWRKKLQVAEAIFFLFAAIFVLGFFMGIASGGELVMLLIFVTGLTVAGFVTRKRKGINKEFMENMQQDFFQVMDCKAFDADPNTDIIGCGTVKIYNEQGQYCRDFFAVDKEAVKEYVRGEEPSFLLMKCVCTERKPEEFYRLFSKKGLRGR